MGLVVLGHEGGAVLIHGDVGVLILGSRSEVVASGQTVRAPRWKAAQVLGFDI